MTKTTLLSAVVAVIWPVLRFQIDRNWQELKGIKSYLQCVKGPQMWRKQLIYSGQCHPLKASKNLIFRLFFLDWVFVCSHTCVFLCLFVFYFFVCLFVNFFFSFLAPIFRPVYLFFFFFLLLFLLLFTVCEGSTNVTKTIHIFLSVPST